MESGNASIQFGLLNPMKLSVTLKSGPIFGSGCSQARTSQIHVTGLDGLPLRRGDELGFSHSVNATTVVPTPKSLMPMVTSKRVNSSEKLEKFAETDFKWWQQKMTFYMTTRGLVKCIRNATPILTEGADRLVVADIEAWKHSNFLCKNYIINSLVDKLYAVYSEEEFTRNLWDSPDKKYKVMDAGQKNFVAMKFLRHEMKDFEHVMLQIHDMQVLLHNMTREELMMNETLEVTSIVEKLPPSWVDFMSYLHHKQKGMTFEKLYTRLRIEKIIGMPKSMSEAKLRKLRLMLWRKLQNAMLVDKAPPR